MLLILLVRVNFSLFCRLSGLAVPLLPKPDPEEEGHGYSNVAILYLQKVIEKLTGSNIEMLARKHVFEPCGMTTDSSFGVARVLLFKKEPLLEQMQPTDIIMCQENMQLTAYWIENGKKSSHTISETAAQDIIKMLPKEGHASENPDLINAVTSEYSCPQLKPQATNSLRTTATDYANFVKFLMNDTSLENPFVAHVYMTEDKGKEGMIGVVKGKISDDDLTHVAWGLGWGLQTDNEGNVTTAYHSGDMNDCRAWVAMNLNNKTAVVYFANSHNGHILAEQIIPPTINLEHAANYFFQKWGFARNFDELGGKPNKSGINPALKQQLGDEKSDKSEIEIPASKEEEQTDINKSTMSPLQNTPTPNKWGN